MVSADPFKALAEVGVASGIAAAVFIAVLWGLEKLEQRKAIRGGRVIRGGR